MSDYQKMYSILCVAASKALDTLPDTAENTVGRDILQKALYEAEYIYIATTDDVVQEQQSRFVYDLVDKILLSLPADKVYLSIVQLCGELGVDPFQR